MNLKKKSMSLTDSMAMTGLGLAIFYWTLESVFSILRSYKVDLSEWILGQSTEELAMRTIVLCLFIIFGSHVQYNINIRKKAEEKLRQSEEKYRSILESIKEGYYEIDITGNLTFFNKSMRYILDYDSSELMGMNYRTYMDKDNITKLIKIFKTCYKARKPVGDFDCEFITKNGSKRAIDLSVSPIVSPKQKTIGFRGMARDITKRKQLEIELLLSYKNTQHARIATIMGLAKLAEYRDTDTGSHLERIREYAKIIAEEMAKNPKYKDYITKRYIEDIYHSSVLHDIGKVGIPDSILLKPGKLSDEEYEIMKSHAKFGGDTITAVESRLEGQSFLTLGREIAYHHHERWDGKGYPSGLKGDDIPLSARNVALADVYDALTSKRVYKKAFTHEEAKDIILKEKGKQFDPDVVDIFLAQEEKFRAIRKGLHEKKDDSPDSLKDEKKCAEIP